MNSGKGGAERQSNAEKGRERQGKKRWKSPLCSVLLRRVSRRGEACVSREHTSSSASSARTADTHATRPSAGRGEHTQTEGTQGRERGEKKRVPLFSFFASAAVRARSPSFGRSSGRGRRRGQRVPTGRSVVISRKRREKRAERERKRTLGKVSVGVLLTVSFLSLSSQLLSASAFFAFLLALSLRSKGMANVHRESAYAPATPKSSGRLRRKRESEKRSAGCCCVAAMTPAASGHFVQ